MATPKKEDKSDLNKCLTVKDVIEILSELDPNAEFVINFENDNNISDWIRYTKKEFLDNVFIRKSSEYTLSKNEDSEENFVGINPPSY